MAMPGAHLDATSFYSIRADGTGKHALTGPGNQYPSWTPDGRIIFVSNRSGSAQIWIMDADGANAAQIGQINPAIEITRVQMAETGLIAFRAGGDGVWLMQRDGSDLREVVRFDQGAGDAPSLARSGTWLTYTAPAPATPGHNEIFRINTDGTGKEQLTFTDDSDYPDANASAISPDESRIAIYTGVESHAGDTPLTWGHRNIGLIGPHGGARTLLTTCKPIADISALPTLTAEDCQTSDNPSWSPDGRWIVYDRGSTQPAGQGTWAIDLAGNHRQQLSLVFAGGGSVPFRY
jgi:Tol biopolymer transport system component